MEESPIVIMDDEFLARFSETFAEKATPVYQEMLNEKLAIMQKYSYFACWCSALLGITGTMLITNLIMGAY